jgi:cytochrome c556
MSIASKLALGAALGCAIAMTTAWAQDVKPERAIKYRQGIMAAQGWNMGAMAAMVKGERPYSKDEFLKRATYLDQLVQMPWEGYTPGSDQGAPTKVKPEIWKDTAKFKQYGDKLAADTAKLVVAARTGDMNQIKPVFGEVGKVCNDCHDDFRMK